MKKLYRTKCKWIWDEYENVSYKEHELIYFRREFYLYCKAYLKIRASADSRYKLYINGSSVSIGPCKGDQWRTYYETVDLSPYLNSGKNVISAKVLHYPDMYPYKSGKGGPVSVFRFPNGGFLLDGVLIDEDGNIIYDISTNNEWKVKREEGIEFIPADYGIYSTSYECIDGRYTEKLWKEAGCDYNLWRQAVELSEPLFSPDILSLYGQLNGWQLVERPIPPMHENEMTFKSVTRTNSKKDTVKLLLQDEAELIIAPFSHWFFELDAGELTTAFFILKVNGGRDSEINIIYSECYEEYANGEYKKGIRDDINGVLRGDRDIYKPGGANEEFEPFWFRTFRYIRIEGNTSEEELKITKCCFRETGYPLDIGGKLLSSNDYHKKLWDISVRTLKRCMNETFIDCPYYEQLQYILDTRLQALFSYQISKDDRLARKAIEDFQYSFTPFGLLQSRYPSIVIQIIPNFSFQWIFMIEDHLKYFGDLNLVKRYRTTIDAILDWYERKITQEGLIGQTGYWPFVDWVEGWDVYSVPTAYRFGPLTIDSLLYVAALKSAANLNLITGRKSIAQEYLDRAKKMSEQIKKYCWDEKEGLFSDGPGIREFSQHVQVWAVLSDVAVKEDAPVIILNSINKDIPKVSYAMSFFLFRAMEKAGLYNDNINLMWRPWERMADLHLTTWVEDPVIQRSDCHGWGALPLYEFSAMILGVKPSDIGFKSIEVKPFIGNLSYAKGTVMTINGPVYVNWHIDHNRFFIEINGPSNIPIDVYMPDDTIYKCLNGKLKTNISICD